MVEEREKQDELLSTLLGIQNELHGIKKKGAKQLFQIIISVILTLIIGFSAGIVFGQHWDDILLKISPNEYANSTATILVDKLTKQAKLNTGLYEQTSIYDSGKLYNSKVFAKLKVNSKSMQFEYTGYVEAGINNLADAKVSINSKTNIITIENIKIEITNVYVDPSSITNAEQSKNIFNQLTIEDFANCDLEELETLIHPCGFYKNKAKNIKKCANQILENFGGEVPSNMEDLVTLAGVGRKSANVIMLEVFGEAKRNCC